MDSGGDSDHGLQSVTTRKEELKLVIIKQAIYWKMPKTIFQPCSFVVEISMITGEVPIFRFLYIVMLDRIVMDLIEARPEIRFTSDTSIPVTIPDGPSASLVQGIQFIRCASVETLHENAKIVPALGPVEERVMIRKRDPSN